MTQKRTQRQNLALLAIAVTVLAVGILGITSSYATSANSSSTTKITPDYAATIAVNHIGAQPSNVVKVDLDNENGISVYSVEIQKAGQEFDVKVDPNTAQVLKVEQQPIGTDANDGSADASNGDGETNDDSAQAEPAGGDGDGETNDDSGNK